MPEGVASRGRLIPFGRCRLVYPSAPGVRTIRTLASARASFLSAGAVVCLAGCITGAPIPPTYTQDELKMICERNRGSWYRDDLMGGFCERR